jgi:hypothetical protein
MADWGHKRGADLVEVVLLCAIFGVVAMLLAGAFSGCDGTSEEIWVEPAFWALHEAGTRGLGTTTAPPPEPAPAGDHWVRAAVFRCEACGEEFVGYHYRLPADRPPATEAPGDPAMTDIARPGGPWVSEEDERAVEIIGVACPNCGETGRRVVEIGPPEADRARPAAGE